MLVPNKVQCTTTHAAGQKQWRKKTAINAEKFKRDRPINRPTNWRKKWGVVSRSMWLKIQTNEDNIDTQSKSFK